MIKLFRKGLQAQTLKTARGGHGWDAPPPPLPAIYEHKRIVICIVFYKISHK